MESAAGGRPGLRFAAASIAAGILLGIGWLSLSNTFMASARTADGIRRRADRVRIDLLECRRREKDFLLRSLADPAFYRDGTTLYLRLHEDAVRNLETDARDLLSLVPPEELSLVERLLTRRSDYDAAFRTLVAAYRNLGFNTWGIAGRLNAEYRELERIVESIGQEKLRHELLLLKVAESEYLLLSEERPLRAAQQRVDALRASAPGGGLQDRLDRYLKALADYHATTQEVGLNENLGLQGKFREAAHEIEPLVGKLLGNAESRYQAAIRNLRSGILGASILLAALLSTTFLMTVTARVRNRRLAAVAAELSRSNEELQQFAYVASHDLQEPLRAVAGCAQLLQQRQQGKLDDRSNELILHTVDGAMRMQTLIEDLLTLSRVGTKAGPVKPADAGQVLQAALQNLTVAIRESGATVTSDTLPTVAMDSSQMTQVFQNLIGNAIKFRGPRPPLIHVGAERLENRWRFFVRDNGIGIERQYFEQIFKVFQRLHTRKEYPGSGIGLAVCRKILVRHGGEIWLESQVGQGSTFYFTLPDKVDAR